MKIGIDATNIGAGGGVTHLKEILSNFDQERYKNEINKVVVFSSNKVLDQLPNYNFIDKVSFNNLNKNLLYRVWFQLTQFDAEIEKMKQEAEANADEDNKKKEEAETVNQADSLIFQTEKQLEEYGDKIPEDKKAPIEEALTELKTAHESKDVDAMKAGVEKLNTVFQAASEEMYKAQADAGAQPEGGAEGASTEGDEEVTDVDFEEVTEDN